MKTTKDKETGFELSVAETPLEAVEELEDFLIADFGQKDWNEQFLARHFKICKDRIKKLQESSEEINNNIPNSYWIFR